jgi:hypothetical protein
MAQPVFPDKHTISAYNAFPVPEFMARSRREIDTIDAINARQFEPGKQMVNMVSIIARI